MKKFVYDNDRKAKKRGKKYLTWRKRVIKRDNGMCDICGDKEHLSAHHKNSWIYFPELRYVLTNGITLCKNCHTIFHCDYLESYRAKATEKDYSEFKKIAMHYMR